MDFQSDLIVWRMIAKLIRAGKNREQIAMACDLKPASIVRITESEEFQEFFKKEDPNAFKKWRGSDQTGSTGERIAVLAREDSAKAYKLLRELVFDPTDDSVLDGNEQARYLIEMLKIANRESDTTEEIHLAEEDIDKLAVILDESHGVWSQA